MIIEKEIPEEPKTVKEFLEKIFASFIYHKIKKPNGSLYGIGFYYRELKRIEKWIKKNEPSSSIARLRNKGRCSYCKKEIHFDVGVGDHIVGKKLNSALWIIPCCQYCNSSKGNRDLLEWWIKKRNILDMKKDVIAIYVRGKYRLLENEKMLKQPISDVQSKIFKDIWRNKYDDKD